MLAGVIGLRATRDRVDGAERRRKGGAGKAASGRTEAGATVPSDSELLLASSCWAISVSQLAA